MFQLKDGKFEEQEQYVELAALKFRKILDIRIKIQYNKLKKLLKDSPARFIDVEEEVFLFSSTLHNWCRDSTTSTPTVDWFDNPEFPPLPAPSRPDWTVDLVMNVPTDEMVVSNVLADQEEDDSHQSQPLDNSVHVATSADIAVTPYSAENFKPLILHDVNVSDNVISLC